MLVLGTHQIVSVSFNIKKQYHWHTSEAKLLDKQLSQWFEEARENGVNTSDNCKIIIAPHAGLTYCGKTSAHGYAALNPTNMYVLQLFNLQNPKKACFINFIALQQTHNYSRSFTPCILGKLCTFIIWSSWYTIRTIEIRHRANVRITGK